MFCLTLLCGLLLGENPGPRGWRDGSEMKNSCCSAEDRCSVSAPRSGSSQSPVMPTLQKSGVSSLHRDLHRCAQLHTCTQTFEKNNKFR